DEVADLVDGEHRRRQLGLAVAGDEDLAGRVDPDLLDEGVVEVPLQRPEARHRVEDALDGRLDVAEHGQPAVGAALVVVADRRSDEIRDLGRLPHRVQPGPADQLTDLGLDRLDSVHGRLSPFRVLDFPREPSPVRTRSTVATSREPASRESTGGRLRSALPHPEGPLVSNHSPASTGRDLAQIATFAGIIAVLGLIPAIAPFGGAVPITAQSLGVMLAGAVLGPRRGGLAVLLLLTLVAID